MQYGVPSFRTDAESSPLTHKIPQRLRKGVQRLFCVTPTRAVNCRVQQSSTVVRPAFGYRPFRILRGRLNLPRVCGRYLAHWLSTRSRKNATTGSEQVRTAFNDRKKGIGN